MTSVIIHVLVISWLTGRTEGYGFTPRSQSLTLAFPSGVWNPGDIISLIQAALIVSLTQRDPQDEWNSFPLPSFYERKAKRWASRLHSFILRSALNDSHSQCEPEFSSFPSCFSPFSPNSERWCNDRCLWFTVKS